MENPFPKLYAQARRGHAEDQALINELGAYYTSVIEWEKRSPEGGRSQKKYDFYEFIGEGEKND